MVHARYERSLEKEKLCGAKTAWYADLLFRFNCCNPGPDVFSVPLNFAACICVHETLAL